jgi:hypothetical protein
MLMAAEKNGVGDDNSENRVITSAASTQLGWSARTNFTVALHALEATPTQTYSGSDEATTTD